MHRFDPDWAVAPGEILAELLEEHGLSRTQAAEMLNISAEELEHFLAGRVPLTQTTAEALQAAFLIPIHLWWNLEQIYREFLMRKLSERSELR